MPKIPLSRSGTGESGDAKLNSHELVSVRIYRSLPPSLWRSDNSFLQHNKLLQQQKLFPQIRHCISINRNQTMLLYQFHITLINICYKQPLYPLRPVFLVEPSNSQLIPSWLGTLLIRSGDVETNPGPSAQPNRTPKWPCPICSKSAQWRSIQCKKSTCRKWTHIKCAKVDLKDITWYNRNGTQHPNWFCDSCQPPKPSSTTSPPKPLHQKPVHNKGPVRELRKPRNKRNGYERIVESLSTK